MIRFALKCSNEHSFESWFQSGAAFEKVNASGMVSCPDCGDTEISKAVMAPRVQSGMAKRAPETDPTDAAPSAQSAPPADIEKQIRELKAHIEATSDYVGDKFSDEARAIHDGDAPERPIYGETSLKDAKSLIDDGIPVAPLPFVPARKTN